MNSKPYQIKSKLPYLNLGCGATFHLDWTNIDFVSSGKDVIAHNLIEGIPFESSSFEVTYHSHVLEHFLKNDARNFILECNRVLKQGGLIRVAIPDLEQIAINYLNYLNQSIEKVPGAHEKYNWTMLEMYDQTIRTKMGGEMLDYIADESHDNDHFLLERNGDEVRHLIEELRNPTKFKHAPSYKHLPLKFRIKNKILHLFFKEEMQALAIGRFRLTGEIHQWMYDRFSLTSLLEDCGFANITICKANESKIPNWNQFNLDIKDGKVRKPDSLFVEAVKK